MNHNQKQHRSSHASRRKRCRRKLYILCGLVVAVFIAVALLGAVWKWKSQEKYDLQAANPYDMTSDYHQITYNGKHYKYNNLITTVLVAGIDSEGPMMAYRSYGKAPRADSIQLAVLDKRSKKMTIIALNRDTITKVRSYDSAGHSLGVFDNLLSLSFGFGTGGKSSCENLLEAVSTLMGDIPIHEYIIGNLTSLPWVNQLVGGVTVTVPNDDLVDQNPEFYEGNTVTITDEWIEPFLRSRDINIAYSNQGRTERQKAFITAYVNLFKQRLQDDLEGVWKETEGVKEYFQTSITKNQYIDLANKLGVMDFEETQYYQPEGTYQQGNLHDEFYVDQEALMEKIIEIFYIEA